ncbi:MAG: glutathione S-transferase family protein [Parvibaculum sp.]|uniref:glutathione S-transferase family protein n=1 Tax=Parvibaculum sp. TaxID=2024848 RepID=UPI00284D482B|nr:glutathione S-transferase family protein [Parvibaculum sp.]MDR3499181.1 glutathione S-transferase family protein [Parvibaculum sp.]
MRLHQMQNSGNCYKPRLLAHQLGLSLDLIDVDMLKGETRKPAFLAKNPNGRVPLLELDDGRTLPESNAMLFYLADGTRFLPEDRFARAEALQWMFFEQYSHEPYIAVARFWQSIAPEIPPAQAARFPEWHEKGYAALGVMEGHLATRPFFAAGRYSIADIALYAYTHVAHEGGFSLARFPHVTAWLARVAGEAGHVPMDWRP